MEVQIRDSFKSVGNDCDLQVTINTKSINSRRIKNQVSSDMSGLGQNT